jgi:hypothetical protein
VKPTKKIGFAVRKSPHGHVWWLALSVRVLRYRLKMPEGLRASLGSARLPS